MAVSKPSYPEMGTRIFRFPQEVKNDIWRAAVQSAMPYMYAPINWGYTSVTNFVRQMFEIIDEHVPQLKELYPSFADGSNRRFLKWFGIYWFIMQPTMRNFLPGGDPTEINTLFEKFEKGDDNLIGLSDVHGGTHEHFNSVIWSWVTRSVVPFLEIISSIPFAIYLCPVPGKDVDAALLEMPPGSYLFRTSSMGGDVLTVSIHMKGGGFINYRIHMQNRGVDGFWITQEKGPELKDFFYPSWDSIVTTSNVVPFVSTSTYIMVEDPDAMFNPKTTSDVSDGAAGGGGGGGAAGGGGSA